MAESTNIPPHVVLPWAALIALVAFIAGWLLHAFVLAEDKGARSSRIEREAIRLGYGEEIDHGGFWSGGYEFRWKIPPSAMPKQEPAP